LKTGGNFPYLSQADETNVYLQVHLRKYSVEEEKTDESDKLDEKDEVVNDGKQEEKKCCSQCRINNSNGQ